jgi:Fe-S cluster biosynthesis and repair protein YggX
VLRITPHFSKAYQLLGETFEKLGDTAEAIATYTQGYQVAHERGDNMPRDAMGKALHKLGAAIPQVAQEADEADDGTDTGFRCARPMCLFGKKARPLGMPPLDGPIGVRIEKTICAGCWDSWKKDFSIKVINELRLDLSAESGASEYDKHMRDFFGFEDSNPEAEAATTSQATPAAETNTPTGS